MGKLSALKPMVARLPSRLGRPADGEGHSPVLEPWRNWYKLAAWERLRRRVFKRDHYTCQMPDCGEVTPRPIADHAKPHRGDPVLFWDEANVQTLCKPCHDGRKQAQEHAVRATGG